jgi:hypothetical protein
LKTPQVAILDAAPTVPGRVELGTDRSSQQHADLLAREKSSRRSCPPLDVDTSKAPSPRQTVLRVTSRNLFQGVVLTSFITQPNIPGTSHESPGLAASQHRASSCGAKGAIALAASWRTQGQCRQSKRCCRVAMPVCSAFASSGTAGDEDEVVARS